MRTLIIGRGQLGHALARLLPEAATVRHPEFDLGSWESVKTFDWEGIGTVINAAAFTLVDAAETVEGSVRAWRTNAQGVAHLAAIARERDLLLVHVSSDYVFDGEKTEPYREDDPVNPQGVYGRSKAGGDLAATGVSRHYVLRTSWVYYHGGQNFVNTMLRLGRERGELEVVGDQVGRPTHAGDLAAAIVELLERAAPFGIYNCTNSGEAISWADLARAVMETAGLSCRITPVTTRHFAQNRDPFAPRPAHSGLDLAKLERLGIRPRHWREALTAYLAKELEESRA